MKKILLVLFFPLFALAQVTPEFLQLKPVYTKFVRFDYTGAIQTWTVPVGVTKIFIDVQEHKAVQPALILAEKEEK